MTLMNGEEGVDTETVGADSCALVGTGTMSHVEYSILRMRAMTNRRDDVVLDKLSMKTAYDPPI